MQSSKLSTQRIDLVDQFISNLPNFILAAVALLTIIFLAVFLRQVSRANQDLLRAINGLISNRNSLKGRPPAELDALFPNDPLLHIWNEYSDTLHPMRLTHGVDAVVEYRSSMPAEGMFTKELLVDGPVFDDFWRHLPGILTGLGIVGTFAGLLRGLGEFRDAIAPEQGTPGATTDAAAKAVAGLAPLLDAVMHAFIVSAIAIFCAMAVVFISRLLIAKLNVKVERLCDLIDSLYQSGAGEEYLQRLVESAEKSETHAAQLKDALVQDLTTLLTNLTERQIKAQEDSAKSIGETITSSMAGPMADIGRIVEANAAGNTQQVATALDTLLTGFMARLEDTFGAQIHGINEQIQRSMASMEAVQTALQTLVQDIQHANESATSRMSERLAAAMQASAENQQQLTEQMSQFVTEFRALLSEEQNRSRDAMNQAVADVLAQLGTAISNMESTRRTAAEGERQRNVELTTRTGDLVTGLSATVDELLKTVSDQVLKTQASIDALRTVSLRAIDGMNQGAVSMGSAAQRFQTAGDSVTQALTTSASLIDQARASAAALQTASLALNSGFEKYDSTRRTVDSQVLALTGLIESAKREAGMSKDLIDQMRKSVDALKGAESESRANLDAVNQQLKSAFEVFGTTLVEQVRRVSGETDKNISTLSNQLIGVVQELTQFMHRTRRQ